MKVTDHGQWVKYYKPDSPLAKHGVLFCRRESDGLDWYDFQRELRNDNIKMTIQVIPAGWLVQATARDPSLLFPGDLRLLEVDDTQSEHEAYRQKMFDPARQLFADRQFAVDKTSFLLALHSMGLLAAWKAHLSEADDVSKIVLESDRPLEIDNEHLREAATKLGWSLPKIFDNARSRR